ncbi:hypothetical protein JX265_005820 [Neoarthrinium moseri]|uniref:Rhodopsin domain-containing protein n=1 Tax=Neoarthrinium moseri TaxID=1658444 RepID=A0A9P9WND1_9PEZI|nr:hypothetical protein JX266_009864 [Neoarthrinium moseri]KAI1871834.1 hypothetical protein JX265_005820 [Neoarthrinium moseri]
MSGSTASPEAQAAMAEAIAAATRAFNTELWTLYSFGVLVTCLRTYSRINAVGFRNLRADDYIVWLSIVLYTTQSTLAYFAVNYGQGLANNSMTDAQRAALDPNSTEYALRVFGSKIQVVGWTSYCCLICTLKLAVLVFYVRLTEGLGRRFRMRIWIGFALVGGTFFASIIAIYAGCQPLEKYWQINPNPGNFCQGAIADPIVWVTFSSSVVTDIYLIMIPLPMLWGTTLKLAKKIGSTFVLGAGVFVLVCSLLKTVFVEIDPVNGAQLAGEWGTREAFTSVVTTNLPMLFPLIRAWFGPFFGSAFSSDKTPYNHATGFRTIGGSEHNTVDISSRRREPSSAAKKSLHSATYSVSGSEEFIFNESTEVKLQKLTTDGKSSALQKPAKGIFVSSEFHVMEGRASQVSDPAGQRAPHQW